KVGKTCFDALIACLPAGTVSGAPKVRAMQIINELEEVKRGFYAGGIGYIDFNHDMNIAIAIRSILIKDKKAYLQAGAGIVADSDPEKEYEETLHKAKSLTDIHRQSKAERTGKIMKDILNKLLDNQNLTIEEMKKATVKCLEENADDAQIAALLTALRMKGETADEMAGMVEVIRAQSELDDLYIPNIMDNCGTGGDQSNSFNISTTTAFVLAGAGVTVAKHGNRSIS